MNEFLEALAYRLSQWQIILGIVLLFLGAIVAFLAGKLSEIFAPIDKDKEDAQAEDAPSTQDEDAPITQDEDAQAEDAPITQDEDAKDEDAPITQAEDGDEPKPWSSDNERRRANLKLAFQVAGLVLVIVGFVFAMIVSVDIY